MKAVTQEMMLASPRAPLPEQLFTKRERAYVAVNDWRWKTAKEPALEWPAFIGHWLEASGRELPCSRGCDICSIIRCGAPGHWSRQINDPCSRGEQCVDWRKRAAAADPVVDPNHMELVDRAVKELTDQPKPGELLRRITIRCPSTERREANNMCRLIQRKVNASKEQLADGSVRPWDAYLRSSFGASNEACEAVCISAIVYALNPSIPSRIYREFQFVPGRQQWETVD